jgi:hypothetical protein
MDDKSFGIARERIQKVLSKPFANPNTTGRVCCLPDIEKTFIKTHGCLFKADQKVEETKLAMNSFLPYLDQHIGVVNGDFKEQGYYIAVINIAALVEFGSKDNPLMQALTTQSFDF